MSKIEEQNIRDSLKQIYNLFEKVDDFIFTTYNYEPDFFDEHIVSYLMGFDKKISTVGELKEVDKWVLDNHISVYYDWCALSTGSSCLTIPGFPQRTTTGGVFHPKVIVIYGTLKGKNKKQTAYLFSSSCNLTVAGYGRNKEAFAFVEITTARMGTSVSNFIKTLNNDNGKITHRKLQEFLESLPGRDDDVEFIWTNSGKGTKLIDYFQKNSSGNLTIISPYFDKTGPGNLLNEIKSRGKTKIFPATEGKQYNIRKKDYEELKKQEVEFYELLEEDSARFIHAKIIKFGSQIFVGSYNFTTAALKGINAEATLIFNNAKEYKFNYNDINENKLLSDEKKISNHDESEIKDSIPFVTVTVKWKEEILCIQVENFNDANYCIRLDGYPKDLVIDLREEEKNIVVTPELSNHLLRHKTFLVYKDGSICYKGLINEIDIENFRPEFSFETLDEALKEWFLYTDEKSEDKRNQRLINPEDVETEKVLGIKQKSTNDIFDNYYADSRAYENFINKVKEISSISKEKPVSERRTKAFLEKYSEWESKQIRAEEKLYSWLFSSPSSIENMVNIFEKEHKEHKTNDIVKEWLDINYLRLALNSFPNVLTLNKILKKNYKQKHLYLSQRISGLEKEINRQIRNNVDKNFLEWIETEFKKGSINV